MKTGSFVLASLVTAVSASAIADNTTARTSVSAVAESYATGVHASYANAVTSSEALRNAVISFTENPTSAGLEAARTAWLEAHRVYSLTEVYRFYDGPIDAPGTGPEPLVNAWPMDEAYVDYVKGSPNAGIINSVAEFPVVDEKLLVSLNEKDGEKNISTGFHAIEFLLWGQDFSADAPGDRPVSDYLTTATPSAKRRAMYLNQVTDLLLKHLKQVQQAWAPAGDNYAAEFKKLNADEQIRRILTGIAMMAGDELSQERLVVPMETGDQEDEQSCFSDTTLVALKQNLEGIRQVYTGDYATTRGAGLDGLINSRKPELDLKIQKKITDVTVAFEKVPLPFDQALQSDAGRKSIEAVVSGLEDLAELLVQAAALLNVRVNLT